MSGASDKATERAICAAGGLYGYDHQHTRAALKAAHDPALGLDRSVCLRDVVKALDSGEWASYYEGGMHDARDFIEGEFAAASAPNGLSEDQR